MSKTCDCKDYVLEGLLKMKNDYTEMSLSFDVNNDKIELDNLISNLQENTESGIKFRQDVYDMVLHYLSKFEI